MQGAVLAENATAGERWTIGSGTFLTEFGMELGGTCALRGCDAKKVLVGAAEALELARRLRGWPELMAFKRSFTDPVPQMKQESFAGKGIELIRGLARFTGPNTLRVGDEVLEGRYVLVAAGAEPMKLGIRGEEHLATSDDFLELTRLPARIVCAGAVLTAHFDKVDGDLLDAAGDDLKFVANYAVGLARIGRDPWFRCHRTSDWCQR